MAGKAAMATASINDLPDSDFAYIEPGGSKDDGGRTVPRSLRHYPIHDKPHVRNALARASAAVASGGDAAAIARKAMPKIEAAAKRMGIGEPAQKGSMAAQHSAQGADVLEDLYELIDCEADEPAHVALLQDAAALVLKFVQAEHLEIGQPGDDMPMMGKARLGEKSLGELKAEPMDGTQLDRWLGGKIPRRILMVPFGGPLPGGKAGLDLDGEYFDDATDLYGPFPALRTSRERLVDWHHDSDPTGVMKGAILGRAVFDEQPEGEGYWADFWANAGEKRRELVAALERRGVPLFGSSQAVRGAVKKADDGHIDTWPLIRHTITTSPQNTYAVVPPLKALLTADIPLEVGIAALKAALVGLDDLEPTLRSTFGDGGETFRPRGKGAGKARTVDIEAIVPEATKLLTRLRRLTANH